MKTSTKNKRLLSIPLSVVALFVIYLLSMFIVSPIKYHMIDNRPILPKGYEIITDGDTFKWKEYGLLFFYSYESLYKFTTVEEAVKDAWEFYNWQNIKEKKFDTVVDVKGINMFSNPKQNTLPYTRIIRSEIVDSIHVDPAWGDSLVRSSHDVHTR